jgi:Zn finger protein HypA/HybF involved in hydrogenase expression
MGVLTTVKDFLQASTESPNRGDATTEESKGAYWCHDCSERIRDVEVEGEGTPDCPECGDEMDFERSPSSTGCAC